MPTDAPSVTPSVASQFTFLTGSSLVTAAPLSSSSADVSLSNADQAPSSVSFSSVAATASPSAVSLPAGLPARIYPAQGVTPGVDNLDGFTLVSILFDQGLRWTFVVNSPQAASQVLAYTPIDIYTACGITGTCFSFNLLLLLNLWFSTLSPSVCS